METNPETNARRYLATDMTDEQWDGSGSNIPGLPDVTSHLEIPKQREQWSDEFRTEEGVSDEQRSIK
jgi:hypothetical protein